MHPLPLLTATIGDTILVLTGLILVALLLLGLVAAVRRLIVVALTEAVTSQEEPQRDRRSVIEATRVQQDDTKGDAPDDDDTSALDHDQHAAAPALASLSAVLPADPRRVAVYGCICIPSRTTASAPRLQAQLGALAAWLDARGWTWTLIDLDGPAATDLDPSGTTSN